MFHARSFRSRGTLRMSAQARHLRTAAGTLAALKISACAHANILCTLAVCPMPSMSVPARASVVLSL
jgi:hypothetical protein